MNEKKPDVQAAQLLESIQKSQIAMRRAMRTHCGHLYMWLWGFIWLGFAVLGQRFGEAALPYINGLAIAGVLASILIGGVQSRQIRAPVDRRFLAALGALLLFGYLAPEVLPVVDNPHTFVAFFAYFQLLWMQPYILAGIWFRIGTLVWIGALISLSILVGLFLFSPIFYVWFAIFAAVPLLLSGFYVRFFRRCNGEPSDG